MNFSILNAEGFYFILRWLHVVFGIVWIGHLYYFNFSQTPFMAAADAATKASVQRQLFPHTFYWFRWSAMFTFIIGWVMLLYKMHMTPELLRSAWGLSLITGGLLGSLMWYNVWFVIWPVQKRVIENAVALMNPVANGKPSSVGSSALVPRAALASRTNTVLSFPLLFFMLSGSHLALSIQNTSLYWISILVIAGLFELNVFKGKMGPMTSIKGFVHTGIGLTILFYVLMEVLTK